MICCSTQMISFVYVHLKYLVLAQFWTIRIKSKWEFLWGFNTGTLSLIQYIHYWQQIVECLTALTVTHTRIFIHFVDVVSNQFHNNLEMKNTRFLVYSDTVQLIQSERNFPKFRVILRTKAWKHQLDCSRLVKFATTSENIGCQNLKSFQISNQVSEV